MQKRSNAWYVLPVILGLIGGLISYVILRDDDSQKAKKCLHIGIILTVVPMVLGAVWSLLA